MHPMITQTQLQDYCKYLQEAERSPGTIQKYNRDLQNLLRFLAGNNTIDKGGRHGLEAASDRKLCRRHRELHAGRSQRIVQFLGWSDCRVKPLRLQRQIFRNEAQG